jgi:ABC-type sugar transport system ATPase subunit
MAIILVSSELEEVIGFSDRIVVLAGGKVKATLDNAGSKVTESQILDYAFGAAEAAA